MHVNLIELAHASTLWLSTHILVHKQTDMHLHINSNFNVQSHPQTHKHIQFIHLMLNTLNSDVLAFLCRINALYSSKRGKNESIEGRSQNQNITSLSLFALNKLTPLACHQENYVLNSRLFFGQ